MNENQLDKEETEILKSYESGEWRSIPTLESDTQKYQAYARATFKKDKRVNIRISSKDLVKLQQRALEEGIPYQTLIASVLHKYIAGRLVDQP